MPDLADWCAVSLVEDGGSIARLAVVHRDPAKEARLREVLDRYPPDPAGLTGMARVLRTGEAEIAPVVADVLLIAAARDAAHLAHLREVGFRSAMIVPLAARGRVLGALSFGAGAAAEVGVGSTFTVRLPLGDPA